MASCSPIQVVTQTTQQARCICCAAHHARVFTPAEIITASGYVALAIHHANELRYFLAAIPPPPMAAVACVAIELLTSTTSPSGSCTVHIFKMTPAK